MTPLLERYPAAGSTGTHGDAPAPPSSGVQDNAVKVAPAARSGRRPGGDGARVAGAGAAAEGAFVCRTCSRRFPSFQALGGHRTGHTRLQARHALPPRQQKPERPAHECAVCGLEFAMGQALGGHMRRHKQPAEAQLRVEVEVVVEEERRRGEEKALDSDHAPRPPLEEHSGGGRADHEGCSSDSSSSSSSGSEPRLLKLFV